MPWYRAGTVSVKLNSNAVIGTGTAFVANSRVGDAFLGPDGGWYEVTNIASDSAMSIAPNYRGATNAAGVYALTPVQGYTKDLADQARAMIQQWGATLAGLGTVSTEDVVPVAKGGTGASTQAAARSGLGLGSASVAAILGTVSQSGGVPSGALMEARSNANGEYFKFACGALICVKRNFNISGFVIAPGAVGGSTLYSFPAAFVDVPAKSFSGYVSDGVGSRTGIPLVDDSPMNGGSIDGWRFHIKNTSSANTQNVYAAHFIAVGRWF
ncbi:phage tail protein [Pseudomonas sp.]|uniref:phage tail protein n=1 Tax=Pseudomonas sp. TaxID=306 RepID=UPI00258A0746|nr:phage tail protein [Pseudomonas sp.]